MIKALERETVVLKFKVDKYNTLAVCERAVEEDPQKKKFVHMNPITQVMCSEVVKMVHGVWYMCLIVM